MSARSTIAVLGGSGHQGRGLVRRFAQAGMPVVVGSRDPARARALVSEWPSSAAIEVDTNAAAVARGDVVVLTVPFPSVAPLLDEVRSHFLAGALVIDVTVPVAFTGGKMSMLEVPELSAAEHVRARVPEHVAVAGAFKTLPAHALDDIEQPLDCDEFVCGDSEDARARASMLVQVIAGLRAVDVGPLARARSIEHVTALAIAINRRHKVHSARFRVVGLA